MFDEQWGQRRQTNMFVFEHILGQIRVQSTFLHYGKRRYRIALSRMLKAAVWQSVPPIRWHWSWGYSHTYQIPYHATQPITMPLNPRPRYDGMPCIYSCAENDIVSLTSYIELCWQYSLDEIPSIRPLNSKMIRRPRVYAKLVLHSPSCRLTISEMRLLDNCWLETGLAVVACQPTLNNSVFRIALTHG